MRLSRLVCIAILALASPVAATEYFVSTTGSNANLCTAGGALACATINGAIGKATAVSPCGDTVTVQAGTYTGDVLVPDMNCSTSRFTLRGDPAAAVGSAIVAGKLTIGTTASTPKRGYNVVQLNLAATSLPMLDIRQANNNYLLDATFDGILVTLIPAPGAADYIFGINPADAASSTAANILIDNWNVSNGGVRRAADLIRCGWSGITIEDSTFSDIGGHILFGSSRSNITITRNVFKNAICTPTGGDADGCIVGYNNANVVVTYNVFDSVSGNDGMAGVINTRRTTSASNPPSLTLRHNTFISANGGTKDSAFQDDGGEGGSRTQSVAIHDNIFIGYGGSDPNGAPIWWRSCPISKTESHNLFYQSANLDISDNGSCGGDNGYGTGDIHNNANPFLGCPTPATCPGGPYVPPISSAVCGAASDGSAIGARACAGAGGTPPPKVTNLRRNDKHF